jgi:Glycosyltransferase family 87
MHSNNSDTTAPRFVLGINEGMLGLFGIAILLVAAVVWSARGPNVEKTDFVLTYVGAQIIHNGSGARLYDIKFQKQVRDSLFQHPNPLLYEHPPFEAFLLSPLAALHFRMAYMLWGISNVVVWLTLIFFMRTYFPRPKEDLGYLFLWVLFAPIAVALYQGQSSIILLGLYAIAFVKLRHEKEFSAGIWLGLGLFKFQFVLPFAFIFLLRKRWRLLAGFGASSVLLTLISLVAVGWKGLVDYGRFVLAISGNPQNLSYGAAVDMPTLHGFVYAVVGRRISHMELNITVIMLSVLLLGFIARYWQLHDEHDSSGLTFASAVAASLLTGLHMFTHDFSPLALALFIALANFPDRKHRELRWNLMATVVLFWTVPIYFLFVAWHCLYLLCPVLLLFAFSTLRASKYVGCHSPTEVKCVTVG